jgi:imidazolonepropionase-like amidohydrolase
MKKSVLLALMMLFTGVMSAQDTVFLGVHVLNMDRGELDRNQAVVVRDGLIHWVGSAADVEVPEGASVVRGDFYLMPGLAEMHAHIPPASQGQQYVDDVLKMYVSQGITTIRGMLGEASHLELRAKSAAGEIIAPRIFTSGPSFNGNSATDPEAAREMVRAQKQAGYDLLKLHPGLSVEVFEAISDEARKQGIDFSGHISYAVGLERTLASGKGTIDHLDRYMEFMAGDTPDRQDPSIIFFGYDLTDRVRPELVTEAARRTKQSGVAMVPTNTLMENVFNPDYTLDVMNSWPGVDLMPVNVRSGWNNFVNILRNQDEYDADKAKRFLGHRAALTKALHEADVVFLLGADAPQIFNPPGYSAHREMALLVDYGFSPIEAIKTGTTNVGDYLNEPDKTGKVAPGYRADLILLDVNPLEVMPFNAHIKGVMTSGTWYDEDTLDSWMYSIRARVNASE